jgi:hypothetical protein
MRSRLRRARPLRRCDVGGLRVGSLWRTSLAADAALFVVATYLLDLVARRRSQLPDAHISFA